MSNENGFKKFWGKNSTLVTMGLVVAVLGTSLYMMSTFSRNTSTMDATDTGTVSKFEYVIKQTEGTDQTLSLSGTTSINIFDTAADSGLPTDRGKILAPGSSGYFELLFKNAGNTPVKVTFDTLAYTDQKSGGTPSVTTPIIFYFNGKYYSEMYSQALDTEGLGFGSAFNSKTGADWTYYFNEGNAENNTNGITLTGNIEALRAELNAFSYNTASTDTATTFIRWAGATASGNTASDQDYIKMAWFYPFEARLGTSGTPTEEGTSTGTGYKVYKYDDYNQKFVAGTSQVTMAPIIRVAQVDKYTGTTKNITTSGADSHGFKAATWYSDNAVTASDWGEDA